MVAYLLCSLIYDLDNRISAEVRRRLNSYTRIDHSSKNSDGARTHAARIAAT